MNTEEYLLKLLYPFTKPQMNGTEFVSGDNLGEMIFISKKLTSITLYWMSVAIATNIKINGFDRVKQTISKR